MWGLDSFNMEDQTIGMTDVGGGLYILLSLLTMISVWGAIIVVYFFASEKSSFMPLRMPPEVSVGQLEENTRFSDGTGISSNCGY